MHAETIKQKMNQTQYPQQPDQIKAPISSACFFLFLVRAINIAVARVPTSCLPGVIDYPMFEVLAF